MQGSVHEISITTIGDQAVGDFTIGATSIVVDDASDFSEGGGQLQANGVVYAYNTVDDETGTITLSSALTVAVADDDPVYVFPLGDEKWAMVERDEQDDVILARVPHALYERFSDGVRDEIDRETVVLEMEQSEWFIKDILAKTPSSSGVFPPGSSTPKPPSDGLPPAISPAVTIRGGIGLLLASWTAVENYDLVTYRVYLGTTAGFTADGSSLVDLTTSTMLPIRTLPGGAPLAYGTDYYVKVIAFDEDGEAPEGAEGIGQMVQVNGPDVAAEYVYAGYVLANQIAAGNLEAALALVGSLSVGTNMVIDGAGITITLNSGGLIQFPSDGSAAIIDSDLRTDDLLVRGGLTINGINNFLNGKMTLNKSVQPPTTAPTVVDSYDFTEGHPVQDGRSGFWNTGSVIGVANGTSVKTYDAMTGALLNSYTAAGSILCLSNAGGNWHLICVTATGVAGGTSVFSHVTLNSSLGLVSSVTAHAIPSFLPSWLKITGGVDPSNGDLYFLYYHADLALDYYLMKRTAAGVTSNPSNSSSLNNLFGGSAVGEYMSRFHVSNADKGALRYWVRTSAGYKSYNSSFALQSTEPFLESASWDLRSPCFWDGTNFQVLKYSTGAASPVLIELTNMTNAARDFKYTFFDSDATGGTHETTPSPVKVFTPKNRIKVLMTGKAVDDQGNPDDPDSNLFYAGATGAPVLQTSPAPGLISHTYDSFVTGTSSPPVTNGFDAIGNAGSIESAAQVSSVPIWQFKGDGEWTAGPFGTDTGWIAPTLQNSWVNYLTAPYEDSLAGYRRVGKLIMLKGLVKSGSVGLSTPIFTLPGPSGSDPGYRPSRRMLKSGIVNTLPTTTVSSHAHAVGNVAARLEIFPDGKVCLAHSTAGNGFLSLEDVWFMLD